MTLSLTLYLRTGRVFGGYSTTSWTSRGSYANAQESFLFRFATAFQRTDSTYSNSYHIYDSASYCPSFGNGRDLSIDSSCRSGSSNPSTYRLQSGYPNTWLTGAQSWGIDALEVFYVNDTHNLCENVTCVAADQCHSEGTCFLGRCSNPPRSDGTLCDDQNATTVGDVCQAGICRGQASLLPGTSHVVSGLEEDTDYEFYAQAFTQVGPGPWSQASSLRMPEAKPSSPPQEVVVQVWDDEQTPDDISLQVMWQAPPLWQQNGPILSYSVWYQSARESQANAGGSGLFFKYLLQKLQPYTDYSVWVVAHNSKGASPPSPAVMVRTKQGVPSGAPPNLRLVSATDTSLTLAWDALAVDLLNGELKYYSLAIQADRSTPWSGGPFTDQTRIGTNKTTMTVTGLAPDALYQVRVSAHSLRGKGKASVAIKVWQTWLLRPCCKPQLLKSPCLIYLLFSLSCVPFVSLFPFSSSLAPFLFMLTFRSARPTAVHCRHL